MRVGRQFPVEVPSVNVFSDVPYGDGLCLATLAGNSHLSEPPGPPLEQVRRTRAKIKHGKHPTTLLPIPYELHENSKWETCGKSSQEYFLLLWFFQYPHSFLRYLPGTKITRFVVSRKRWELRKIEHRGIVTDVVTKLPYHERSGITTRNGDASKKRNKHFCP